WALERFGVMPVGGRWVARLGFGGTRVVVPVLAVALISAGCGGGDTKATGTGKPKAEGGKGEKEKGGGTSSTAGSTPLKAEAFAIVKGKAIYDGTPPPPADIPIPDTNKDKEYCLKGPHNDPSWIGGAGKGVANVVVWVRAPAGKYFEIPADQQKPAAPVVKIDQPFCAFEPHVAVVFPSYFDGKAQQPTGQKLEIANSAKITHNTNWNPAKTNL